MGDRHASGMPGAPVRQHTGSMVVHLGLLVLGVLIYAAGTAYAVSHTRRRTATGKRSRSKFGLLLVVPVIGLGVGVFGALRLSDAQRWGPWALLSYLALLGLAFLLMRRFMPAQTRTQRPN